MAVPGPAPGHRLGPYELGERLGNGGMAEVYVARRAGPHGFKKRVAIKRILPQLAVDSRFVDMFCDEARICAALCHPNVVQVVDFGECDGELFMAMEYVDGVSLARLLRAVAARGERIPVGAALFIATEVLRGLRFAHEARDEHGRPLNIVHRDVSPGNVLLSRAGEVKLTDFGIVLSAFVDRRTYPGELKGKMGYMSPEQVIGDDLDARSDLFTLGIVLAEMLVTRPLFPGKNELDMLTRMYEADTRVLERHSADLPADLVAVVRTALMRERDKRFQSARDFEEELRAVARRMGLVLNDAQLVPWMMGLGILPSQSGTREVSPVVRDAALAQAAAAVRRGPPVREIVVPPVRPAAEDAQATPARRAPDPKLGPPRRPSPPQMIAVPYCPGYQLYLSDQALGPLTQPQVLELIATGRLHPDTRASEDGGPAKPLNAFRAFAALLERAPFQFWMEGNGHAGWQRSVDRRSMPGALFGLVRRRETGLVVLANGRRRKRIFLEEGVPRFVASTDRSELLGASLIRAGLLEAVEVDRALTLAAGRGQRLGEMLVAIGLLRPTALLRTLIDQLEQRFVEIGTWSSARLSFVADLRSEEDNVNSHSSGISLVARAIREGYEDVEIAGLLAPFRDSPIARLPADLELSELTLTPAQRRALDMAPGAVSLQKLVAQLARDAGGRPEETLRGVFVGLCAGVLVMPGWPAALV